MKKVLIFFILFIAILLIGASVAWTMLQGPVDKKDDTEIVVDIENGTSSNAIGNILYEKRLIKSLLIYKLYLKTNHINNLKASKYTFNRSMTLQEIVAKLQEGVISNEGSISVIFKDGLRVTDYAKTMSEDLSLNEEEVLAIFKDREYAKELIEKYWFLTDKILDDNIYYPLEGYLAPDTYYFEPESTAKDVIEKMLKQMETNLEEYKEKMSSDPHYYITMASIVQLEGTNDENRKEIAGVFENRIKNGMNLGSDVTTYYALQESMKKDLTSEQFNTANPYNTRGPNMIGKMPVGPICNPNNASIAAAVEPTETDNLFFVADKNGKIYFTKTNAEHDQKVKELKDSGLWIVFEE